MTRNQTQHPQLRSSPLLALHCVSLHANITHDKSGQWSEASSHPRSRCCPVNGKDAYQTKVHYLHKLCTPHRIRRSLTKSNKHTCVHLHQPALPRPARKAQLTWPQREPPMSPDCNHQASSLHVVNILVLHWQVLGTNYSS